LKVKYLVWVLPLVIVISVIGWLALNFTQSQEVENYNGAEQPIDEEKIYTETEVARHNTPEDCWTIINEKVYDISPYISRHPGGSEIERACGINATSLFETRTTSSGEAVGSGQPHSENANQQLKSLYVGELQ
jgi:cytochrome b involved in lipid metabolism